ncbi:hypothetical protein [Sinomonas terrae]|uniref:Uncharacterized protein n=1 Tax=Sinomonas terrae TaxID=2908838 RepID=A0ABS9U654_9MICC|nr:hypothetical protein [Sinomonas terrae]MCH6471992.1 hypothetical protein [Sinomonas terrae]
MTQQLTVTSSHEADASGDVPQVVASLPVSLHPSDGEDSALVAIAGSPGWTEAALASIASGARGLMVIHPCAADVAALKDRASTLGVPVVVDTEWAHNPAVAAAAPHFAAHDDEDSLLEARVNAPVGADLDQVLLAQLALIRAAVGPVMSLTYARRNRHGYDALAALASGARASLAAILTNAIPGSATLRMIKPETAVTLTLPGAGTAAPGKVTVSGPEGATLLPTQWETAHRAAWRRLHGLADAGRACEDLEAFADDAALVASASSAVGR